MKLVGLMPLGNLEILSVAVNGLIQLVELCDGIVILADRISNIAWPKTPQIEVCKVMSSLPWNDYTNRLTLLARATAHGATHVLWLDADELLCNVTRELNFTRKLIDVQIEAMEAIQHVGISYAVREMWNETQYRSDGIWGTKRRLVIQKNPLLGLCVQWPAQHLNRFHAFPLQCGEVMKSDYQLLHYGMSTPELRKARHEKWKTLDPTNQFQEFGYDYMADESGMILTNVNP